MVCGALRGEVSKESHVYDDMYTHVAIGITVGKEMIFYIPV
jgi:hypothetical protein